MPGKITYIGIKGSVLALDRASGAIVWQTTLKGVGFVNLVLDGGDLIATTRGEAFCLDVATGQVRWNNPLTGMGWGIASIATPLGNPTAVAAEMVRRAQQSASDGSTATSTM
ncbi:MAG TPA: PQQ-binding-like beta-propeller repeat protein [Humisphaera sp.]|nr:PQQ-binding-like beta-propeller repeat protein [Humisphaera sp.]